MTEPTNYHQEAIAQASIKIAVLENQVKALADQNADLKRTLDKLFEKFDTVSATVANINATLSEARGGWKMLMLVGGASASFGAAVVEVMRHFRG